MSYFKLVLLILHQKFPAPMLENVMFECLLILWSCVVLHCVKVPNSSQQLKGETMGRRRQESDVYYITMRVSKTCGDDLIYSEQNAHKRAKTLFGIGWAWITVKSSHPEITYTGIIQTISVFKIL